MPHLDHGYLLQDATDENCELAAEIGCAGIYPNAQKVTPQDIERAQRHGLMVRTWGVKSEDDLVAGISRRRSWHDCRLAIARRTASGQAVDSPETHVVDLARLSTSV